jgi:hypothetical protein
MGSTDDGKERKGKGREATKLEVSPRGCVVGCCYILIAWPLPVQRELKTRNRTKPKPLAKTAERGPRTYEAGGLLVREKTERH